MKKNFVLTCVLLLCAVTIFAQEKTLSDITSFKQKNSGAMMDKENNVDGYFFYYEVDKLKKGQREYAIRILDNNLNEVATKSYVDSKHTYLAQSMFNNQALAFAMINKKDERYKVVLFDRKGEQTKKVEIEASKKEMQLLAMMSGDSDFNFLLPVDDKGFVFNYIKKNKKTGYAMNYIATDGGTSWEYTSDPESKSIHTINPIQANEEVVVAVEMTKKSLLSKDLTLKALVIDIATGKLLFEREFDRGDNPRLITNAFLTEDENLVLLGEYFNAGDKILKAKSQGLFAETVSLAGEVLKDSKVSWEDKIDAMMPPQSDGKKSKRGYVYFHDIVRTQDGSYYAVGERYRKTVSAAGLLGVAGNVRGGSPITQLTITDAVFFKFDEDFNLLDIESFAKGKSRAPSISDFGSPQLNANYLKNFGAFDYEFLQLDPKRNRFYATFIDYERLKGEKNKNAFKAIVYSDGELSEDKIYLEKSNKNVRMRVLPAKLGNVMLLEYNRKEKSINMHMEKLNAN